jgi:hypothetical protein
MENIELLWFLVGLVAGCLIGVRFWIIDSNSYINDLRNELQKQRAVLLQALSNTNTRELEFDKDLDTRSKDQA